MEPAISAITLYLPNLPSGSPTPNEVILDQNWEEASEAFDTARSADLQMLVLFGDVEDGERCLVASAVVTEVEAARAGTRVSFKEMRPLESRPLLPSLNDDQEEPLREGDLNEPRLVMTPCFLTEGPKTFLLTWNPQNKVPLSEMQELRAMMMAGESCVGYWTCRAVKKVRAGDRFFMLRQGPKPRGIIGSGWIRTDAWKSEGDSTPYVDILWQRLVDPERPLDPKTIRGARQVHWEPNGSGTELPEEAVDAVWKAWEAHSAGDRAPAGPQPTPAGMAPPVAAALKPAPQEDAASSVEGRLVESWSSRRERDPANRARCLVAHGHRCAVCDMSFAEEYGEIGEGFIHIHHEQPLAAADDARGTIQDPEGAMKPVCPNCHAMLHRGLDAARGEVRSIAELKALRAQSRTQRA